MKDNKIKLTDSEYYELISITESELNNRGSKLRFSKWSDNIFVYIRNIKLVCNILFTKNYITKEEKIDDYSMELVVSEIKNIILRIKEKRIKDAKDLNDYIKKALE